ncbi:FUSC family protein [Rhodococcus sp. PAM 2766]|uniref:FUSC family protein n=1 Tax=Rhodococcus parequi TaxID=3137122 RepID=A0ABW9FJJ8_9NOCA
MTAGGVGIRQKTVRYLTATDPGFFRLRRALTTVSALAGAVVLLTATGHPVNRAMPAVLLGAFVAVQAASAVKDSTQRDRVVTTALLIVPAVSSVTLGALLHGLGRAADIGFVGVLFVAVWVRRWGPRGFAAGMVAYVAYFYTLVLHGSTADLPLLYAGVCAGVVVTLIVRALVLPERPRREISSLVTAFGSTTRSALEIATRGGRGHRALDRALDRVDKTVGLIEDWIDRNDADLVIGIPNSALSQLVFDVRYEMETAIDARDMAATGNRMCEAQVRLANAVHGHGERTPVREHRPASVDTRTGAAGVSSSTRSALQVAVAASVAALLGSAVDSERWYWAVLTAFLVYTGTSTRGEVMVRAGERVAGTVAGVVAGMLVVGVVGESVCGQTVIVMASVFLAFYLVSVHYVLQTFFMTVMLAGLYELLGEFSVGILVVRVEETVVGAVVGIVAAHTVLASSSREALTVAVDRYLVLLSSLIGKAALQNDPPVQSAELLAAVRALDGEMAAVEAAASTLVEDPATRGRRSVSWLLRRLREINRAAHALVAVGAGVRTHEDDSVREREESGALDEAARGVRNDIDLVRQCNVGAKTTAAPRVRPGRTWSGNGESTGADVEASLLAALRRIDGVVVDLAGTADVSGRVPVVRTDRDGGDR